MSEFLRRMKLRRATRWWTSLYIGGYLSAVAVALDAVFTYRAARKAGSEDVSSDVIVLGVEMSIAAAFAVLTWRIHRWLSVACAVGLFAIVLLSAVMVSFEDEAKETLGAWIFVAFVFRGLLSVRTLRNSRAQRPHSQASADLGEAAAH